MQDYAVPVGLTIGADIRRVQCAMPMIVGTVTLIHALLWCREQWLNRSSFIFTRGIAFSAPTVHDSYALVASLLDLQSFVTPPGPLLCKDLPIYPWYIRSPDGGKGSLPTCDPVAPLPMVVELLLLFQFVHGAI